MRSPTEISMSIARGFGRSEMRCARSTSSSVVSPIADSTATTRPPFSFSATIRRATAFSRSGFPTDVPPNFITTVPPTRCSSAPAIPGTAS